MLVATPCQAHVGTILDQDEKLTDVRINSIFPFSFPRPEVLHMKPTDSIRLFPSIPLVWSLAAWTRSRTQPVAGGGLRKRSELRSDGWLRVDTGTTYTHAPNPHCHSAVAPPISVTLVLPYLLLATCAYPND